MTRAPILAALALAACGDAAPSGLSTGPGVTSVPASTSGSSTGADTTSTGPADDSAGSSTSTSTGAATLDVGTVMDFGPVQPPGCKGKVDLLFVISRQGTMVTEQTQLLASFQGFIDAIQASLEDTVDSYHVGVVSSDNYWANAPGCQTLGDLVTQNDTGAICTPFAEGGRRDNDSNLPARRSPLPTPQPHSQPAQVPMNHPRNYPAVRHGRCSTSR